MKVPLGGKPSHLTNETPAGGSNSSIGLEEGSIVVDDHFAYWTAPPLNAVMKVALDGGPRIVVSSASTPEGLALDATYLYWADASSGTTERITR